MSVVSFALAVVFIIRLFSTSAFRVPMFESYFESLCKYIALSLIRPSGKIPPSVNDTLDMHSSTKPNVDQTIAAVVRERTATPPRPTGWVPMPWRLHWQHAMKKTKCNATILFHDIPRSYDEPDFWRSSDVVFILKELFQKYCALSIVTLRIITRLRRSMSKHLIAKYISLS